MQSAHCGRLNWKFWKKAANGCTDDWSKSYRKKLTAKAGFSPLSARKAHDRRRQPMGIKTVVGRVELKVWHGQDPTDKHWGCPIREKWGLKAHQQMSPALEEKLAFTATLTGSYEATAQVAAKWGSVIHSSVIHGLVQRVGGKAQAQSRERLKQLPQERDPKRAASELALVMLDGWFGRFRGPGWGKSKTNKERVEWHEIKNGVFYLQEHSAKTQAGRGLISEKTVVRSLDQAVELGQRLHWEAMRGGLGRAKEKLVLGDGGAWIWNLKANRWPEARELLDFWHAGQHLWSFGRACNRMDEAKAKIW